MRRMPIPALRGDTWEPLYAASPTVLFVLSSELEPRLAANGGRSVSGSFDVPFIRAD